MPHQSYRPIGIQENISIIDTLSEAGVQMINISGGEPTQYPDLGALLDYCGSKNIFTILNTNGHSAEEKINDLRKTGLVKLSFDGPERIHDAVRGKGSHKKVMRAIKILKEEKIPFVLCAVPSLYNIHDLARIVRFAEECHTAVLFQPMSMSLLGSEVLNPHHASHADHKKAFLVLLRLKKDKQTAKYILNSKRSLTYFLTYPDVGDVLCASGKVFCHITPDGYFAPCARQIKREKKYHFSQDFERIIDSISAPQCKQCVCPGMLELNVLYRWFKFLL
jgi:MoaA/NifB/PqqE/SkfB family radical SAM enzyme